MSKLIILIVDDELAMRESIAAWLTEGGHLPRKAESAEQALEMLQREPYDVALVDLKMPGMGGHELLRRIQAEYPELLVIIMTAFGTIESAVRAIKGGAHDYLPKPFDPEHLMVLLQKIERHKRLMDQNLVLREALARGGGPHDFENMVACSPAMLELFQLLEQVAATDAPVLILGETGTGKELVAWAIHNRSSKAYGHFVPLNCGAQSESLLESELFGHERGAFTGAVKARRGRLEMADGGTLFLDEVGEISTKMQIQLLRVLENGQFHRVGGNLNLTSDFRLISATHRDLRELSANKLLRTDFFYRINVVTIEIPPLRERVEDLQPLAEHFLRTFSSQTCKRLTEIKPQALRALEQYHWPGNVRELRNVIERAVILAQGHAITTDDLRFYSALPDAASAPRTLAQAEKVHIASALEACAWNVKQAAKRLGIDRSTLSRKIKALDLRRAAC